MKVKYKTGSLFFEDIKKETNKFFEEQNIAKTGDKRLCTKAIILLTLFAGTYLTFLSVASSVTAVYWLAVLLGLLHAMIGFNIMHDASHGAFSQKAKRNDIIVRVAEWCSGVSSRLWITKHVVIHHSYTNTHLDDDIQAYPFLRLSTQQKRLFFHRFQFLYAWALYALLHIIWVFVKDPVKYFSGKINGQKFKPLSTQERIIFWASKVWYVCIFLVIPILVFGFQTAVIAHLIMTGTCGLLISIVFQLAHINEKSTFPVAENGTFGDWALLQVQETADFAPNNLVIDWICGGLNQQVTHHLCPKVSHVHYRKLRLVLLPVYEKHHAPYKSYSLFGALWSHIKTLHLLGKKLA